MICALLPLRHRLTTTLARPIRWDLQNAAICYYSARKVAKFDVCRVNVSHRFSSANHAIKQHGKKPVEHIRCYEAFTTKKVCSMLVVFATPRCFSVMKWSSTIQSRFPQVTKKGSMRGDKGEPMMTRERWALDKGEFVPDKHPGQAPKSVIPATATSPVKHTAPSVPEATEVSITAPAGGYVLYSTTTMTACPTQDVAADDAEQPDFDGALTEGLDTAGGEHVDDTGPGVDGEGDDCDNRDSAGGASLSDADRHAGFTASAAVTSLTEFPDVSPEASLSGSKVLSYVGSKCPIIVLAGKAPTHAPCSQSGRRLATT